MDEIAKLIKAASAVEVNKIDLDDKEAIRNILELLLKLNKVRAEENQRLRDEIARLKGEKGKPKIRANAKPKDDGDKKPRKKPEKWKKDSKNDKIKIDREEKVQVNKDNLPSDAVSKGYREIIIQDIKITTENVKYLLERYYSPSKHKTYEGQLPKELTGTQFGTGLKAFIINLYFNGRVTEHKIRELLLQHGILISEGEISNILTKEDKDKFSKEKKEIFETGMASSEYIHTDDTGARHCAVGHYTLVLCNLLFAVFFTTRNKANETIRKILELAEGKTLNLCLISDDARQFWYLALLHALCWVHEIRHFKKMDPHLEVHRRKVDKFLTEIYDFYSGLKKYKKNPSVHRKKVLEKRFEDLFSRRTGYWLLDKRIELTKAKKDRLLLVLDYPAIPLHNNPAELDIREFVIKRKISYGTRSEDGRIAWENMMSILTTCKKHGVSFYDYVKDILSDKNTMTKLSVLIERKADLATLY